MKKNRKYNYSKTFKRQRFLIALFMGILLISMSVGYALYNEELLMESTIVVEVPDEVMIYSLGVSKVDDATYGDIVYRTTDANDYISLDSDLDFEFSSSSKVGLYASSLTYVYEIVNLSNNDYTYSEFIFNGNMSNNETLRAPVIKGITAGDVIGSRETKFVYVTYYYPNDLSNDISVDVSSSFIFKKGDVDVPKGSIRTSIDKTEIELNDSKMADVNVDIMNLFDSSVIYDIKLSNSNVILTNSTGNSKDYNYIVNSGATNEHHVYMKVKDGVDLSNDIITDIYILTEDGKRYTIGTLTLVGESRAKYSKVVVDYRIEESPGWADHYFIYFNITNNDTVTMDQYTIYVYFKDSLQFTEVHNYNSMVVYDPVEHVLKLSSKDRWNNTHKSVAPGDTVEFTQTVVGMNASSLAIDKIIVYKDAETYTDGFSYKPNGY